MFGYMPWVTNDLCSPSTHGFLMPWMTDSLGNTPTPTSSAATADPASRIVPISSSSSGSDLMDFSADDRSSQLDPVYIDLADFDPLYTVDSKAWNREQRFDSDELFLQRGSSSPRSAAVLATRPTEIERPLAPLPDVVAQSSVARLRSTDELQDPFSVQDLMASLEKKRQQHAREQEAQDLNSKTQPTHNVTARNATLSKRKVNY